MKKVLLAAPLALAAGALIASPASAAPGTPPKAGSEIQRVDRQGEGNRAPAVRELHNAKHRAERAENVHRGDRGEKAHAGQQRPSRHASLQRAKAPHHFSGNDRTDRHHRHDRHDRADQHDQRSDRGSSRR